MKTAAELSVASGRFATREFPNCPGWRLAIVRHFCEGFYGLVMQKTHAANPDATRAYHEMQDKAYAAGAAFRDD